MNNIDTFVSIVKDIKKQIASRKLGYRIGGNVMKLSSNNFSLNIRTDCSGFVSACVSCLKNKNIIFSTYSQSNALINNGFKKLPFTSWNELKTGDILMRDTHTEVFSHNEGNKHYVWNCGSDYSNNNSGVTLSIGGHHTVFRLIEGVINMANSPLVKYTKISPNKTLNKKYKVDTIIPHCIVGQMGIESLGDWFSKSSTKASSNYGIGFDGRVGMYVEEKDRSWCSSSSEWDNRAITIECASDLKSPYAMKKEVINTLIDLCTDICKRYNKTKLVWLASKSATLSYKRQPNEMLICVHRYLSNTSCPGDYLMGKLSYVADEVNKRLGNNSSNISKEVIQKYHKGEIVMFSGDTHYLSTSSPTGSKCRPGKATVNSFESDGIHNYHLIGMQGGSGVWGWVDEKYISKYTEEDKKEIPKVEEKPKVDNTKKENTFKEYIVRVKTPYLNIRTGPGTNHGTTGKFTGKIAVTIVEEANGPGAPKWGLMKSYKDNRNGWISLDPQFVEKVY